MAIRMLSRSAGVAAAAAGLFLTAASLAAAPSAPAAPCQSTVTGDLRLHTLDSRVFGNSRTIRVLVPQDYDAPANAARHYPVLYLLDGQNLFDACLSDVSHREWGVDETVYRLVREHKVPPLIIVGIDHAGALRAHEFLPYADNVGNPGMPEPAGRRFPAFVVDEVMPLVNGRYRTLTGHENTGIGGSSYGGIATLYALLAKPTVFGYGLIESPTLWIGMGQLVRETGPLAAAPLKVYMGFGGREIGDPRAQAVMDRMLKTVVENFHAAGYDDHTFRYVLDPEAAHNEDAWAKRLPDALTFLFGTWHEPHPPAGPAH